MLTCGPCRFLVADSNLSDLFREALLSSSSDPPLVPGESEGFMRMEFWRGTLVEDAARTKPLIPGRKF